MHDCIPCSVQSGAMPKYRVIVCHYSINSRPVLRPTLVPLIEIVDRTNPPNGRHSYSDLCANKKDCGRRGNPAGAVFYGKCDVCFASSLLDYLVLAFLADTECTRCKEPMANTNLNCPKGRMFHPKNWIVYESGYSSWGCCGSTSKTNRGCQVDKQWAPKKHKVIFRAEDFAQLRATKNNTNDSNKKPNNTNTSAK